MVELVCNHSGPFNQNTKGRDCKYKLNIRFSIDGTYTVEETKNSNQDHSHEMTMGFVCSKNSNLTKNQRGILKKDIKESGGIDNYIIENDIQIENRFLKRYGKNTENDNKKEIEYIQNKEIMEDGFLRITNTFEGDNSIHLLLYIHLDVAVKPY